MDHAGATLASQTQLREVFDYLSKNPLANPHSKGALGERSAVEVSSCRELILSHFGASPEEYAVVFTAGSTASMKLVADCFPWTDNSVYCYPYNSHTSLLGLREYAPTVYYIPRDQLEKVQFPDPADLGPIAPKSHEPDDFPLSSPPVCYSLLALPGECNFSGSKLPPPAIERVLRTVTQHPEGLEAIGARIVKSCSPSPSSQPSPPRSWMWLLDASKLAASSPIHITTDYSPSTRPHFVCVSFYKMFGYPTGIGALLVKKSVAHLLHKR